MKRIITVIILISLSFPSQAQFFKKAASFVGGILFGVADYAICSSDNQELKDSWESVKPQITPISSTASWAATAGSQLAQGDYTGAIVSGLSSAAVAAGVDEDLVALGNSGVTNFINGDNEAAVIDVCQLAAHGAGEEGLDIMFDSYRDMNQINREYRDNIKNGMSIQEADSIRTGKVNDVNMKVAMYAYDVGEERKERVEERHQEAYSALIQRGYSHTDASYLSSLVSLEEVETWGSIDYEDEAESSIDDLLDQHNIGYKNKTENEEIIDQSKKEETLTNESKGNLIVEEKTSEAMVEDDILSINSEHPAFISESNSSVAKRDKTIGQVSEAVSNQSKKKVNPVIVQSNNAIEMGYATYKGDVQNGKPHGNGSLIFSRKYKIPGTNVYAESGEIVTGIWREGKINMGTLYRSNGEAILVKIGQNVY